MKAFSYSPAPTSASPTPAAGAHYSLWSAAKHFFTSREKIKQKMGVGNGTVAAMGRKDSSGRPCTVPREASLETALRELARVRMEQEGLR